MFLSSPNMSLTHLAEELAVESSSSARTFFAVSWIVFVTSVVKPMALLSWVLAKDAEPSNNA